MNREYANSDRRSRKNVYHKSGSIRDTSDKVESHIDGTNTFEEKKLHDKKKEDDKHKQPVRDQKYLAEKLIRTMPKQQHTKFKIVSRKV